MRGIGLGESYNTGNVGDTNHQNIPVDVFFHLGDVVYSWPTVAFTELGYQSRMKDWQKIKEVKIYLSGKD